MKAQISPQDVSDKFKDFVNFYNDFRKCNGLTKGIDNVYEVLTGMTDKHGRICRQIKHLERNDPKPDWPDGMIEAMTGYLIYMLMILEKYDAEISEGMRKELKSAISQYGIGRQEVAPELLVESDEEQ